MDGVSVTVIELHLASVRQITIDFKEGRRLGHPIHEMGTWHHFVRRWLHALGDRTGNPRLSPSDVARGSGHGQKRTWP